METVYIRVSYYFTVPVLPKGFHCYSLLFWRPNCPTFSQRGLFRMVPVQSRSGCQMCSLLPGFRGFQAFSVGRAGMYVCADPEAQGCVSVHMDSGTSGVLGSNLDCCCAGVGENPLSSCSSSSTAPLLGFCQGGWPFFNHLHKYHNPSDFFQARFQK